jgi:hypothetical protein
MVDISPMKNCIRFLMLSAAGFGLCFVSACGQRELPKPKLVPVRGRVTLRGEPARFVTVRLSDTGGHWESTGFTDVDGNFELRTLTNEGEPDGAVPGEYEVTLEPYDPATCGPIPKGAVPTQLAGEFNTGQLALVSSGENELIIDIP